MVQIREMSVLVLGSLMGVLVRVGYARGKTGMHVSMMHVIVPVRMDVYRFFVTMAVPVSG